MAHHQPHKISRNLTHCWELLDSLTVKVLKERVPESLPLFTQQHLLLDRMIPEIVNKFLGLMALDICGGCPISNTAMNANAVSDKCQNP